MKKNILAIIFIALSSNFAQALDFTCKINIAGKGWQNLTQTPAEEGSREISITVDNYEVVVMNFVEDVFKINLTNLETHQRSYINARPQNAKVGLQYVIYDDSKSSTVLLNLNCNKN